MAKKKDERFSGWDTGSVYADRDYLYNHLKDGSLPKIHEDFGVMMDQVPVKERKGALDVGACIGMLSIRGHLKGWSPVHGLEMGEHHLNAYYSVIGKEKYPAITLHRIEFYPQVPDHVKAVGSLIRKEKINTLFARRALPEFLGATQETMGHSMPEDAPKIVSDMFADNGIVRLLIEGRMYSSRSKHKFSHVNAEIEAMEHRYKVVWRAKDCAIMELK